MTPAPKTEHKPKTRHHLEGEVQACTDASLLCVRCSAAGPQHMAQLTSGWLPICAACLVQARGQQAKSAIKAKLREKAMRAQKRAEFLKSKLTVSGGGANGTGRRR